MQRDPAESASLLSRGASSPAVADGGVPLQFIQLDDRFRVSRLTGVPLAFVTLALFISDALIVSNQTQILTLSPSCSTLIGFISFHAYVMGLLLVLLSLMLFRVAHKAFPFVFAILTFLVVLSVPLGLGMLFWWWPCRGGEWSVPYWHALMLAWMHFWPVNAVFMLFKRSAVDWTQRGWNDGKSRGFLSKETERKAFIASPR